MPNLIVEFSNKANQTKATVKRFSARQPELPHWGLAVRRPFINIGSVQTLAAYRKQALRLAEFTFLGEQEGYAARIAGFRGLIATGRTKKETMAELQSALTDWIDLALKRGLGLPALKKPAHELVTAP